MGQHAARDLLDLRRKAARGGIDIDARAEDGVFELPTLHVKRPLGEDAADFFTAHEHVVDPLDLRRFAGDRLDRVADRNGGGGGDEGCVVRRNLGLEQEGDVNARAFGGIKAAPLAPAPARLLGGDDHRALRRALVGELPQDEVGRIHAVENVQRESLRFAREILADAAYGEDVAARREAIATVRHGLNRVAVGLQGFDRLPDRVSAHAEAAGDLLAREEGAFVGLQQLPEVVLYGHGRISLGGSIREGKVIVN